jgi:hypothetical protein
MDVIGFLYVSLGSSRAQLHYSLGSRRVCACLEAGFSSQNGVRAWGVYYRRATFCYAFFFFLWTKGLNAKGVHKCFLFTGGSVCRVKRFTTRSRNALKDVRKSQMVPDEVRKRLRQHSKDCGFRRTGKAMRQVYQCWWRICREINVFFSRFEYRMFYVVYPFVTYLLTLPLKFWR